MKNKKFEHPQIIGELGDFKFVLHDYSLTKEFHSAGEFDDFRGVYPIMDKKGKIVEYMDLVGNFTKSPTKFARYFNEYIKARNFGIGYGSVEYFIYSTALLDFPSKYMTNKKIREIVHDEEMYRYKNACKKGMFISFINKLGYKLYIKNIYKSKIKASKKYLTKDNTLLESDGYLDL